MRRNGVAPGAAWVTLALLLAAGSVSPGAAALPDGQARPKLPVTTTTPPPAPRVPAGTAQITGTIKSAADDKPLARARIIAASPALSDPRVTLSAADGSFAVGDLPAGIYTLTISHTGYAPQTYGQARGISGSVAVGDAQKVSVDVALVPGGVIVGRIFDEDGTPFAGAVVDALITHSERGTDTFASVSTSLTDDHGDFRLYGLNPGLYYVSASDPAFRDVSTAKGGVQHYSPTYYPGVPYADQARTVTVAETGAPPRVEFRLKLVPPAQVSGQLVAYDARQLLSGAVIMTPMEGEGIPMVPPEDISILPDGHFTFGHVVPGRYQIRARGEVDPSGATLFAVYSTLVDGVDIEGLRLTLRPGAILDGKLTVESVRGTKPPVLPTLRVRAPFIDGNEFGDVPTGTVQPDGAFMLRGMMTGAHQITVEGLEPPWILKRVTMRGSDITDLQFDVEERAQFHDVRIVITDAASEVSGFVESARHGPVANVGVLVFSRVPIYWMRTNRHMRMAYTDREGHFSISGLPAGEYLAYASATVDESDLGRRDRLQTLAPVAVPFRLQADDGQATVRLQLGASAPPAVR